MSKLFQFVSPEKASRAAQHWLDSLDPQGKVGSKHHIVPRTILRRFANDTGQVRVRDRFTGKLRSMSINDLAVRDFYTFVDTNDSLNGTMEDWLSEIEAEFARVIGQHLESSGFRRDRLLTSAERFAVDTFVGVQSVRGMRTRRSMELVAEYGVKFMGEELLDPDELQNLQVVPHQNEHIDYLHRASETVAQALSPRPVTIVQLDAPLLIIGDEPVVLTPRDGAPKGDHRNRLLIGGERVPAENLVQMSNGLGVGLDDADEVILPLSPSHALVYFTSELPSPSRSMRWSVAAREAKRIAWEMNRLQAQTAMSWVAAHPAGPHLAQIAWPPPVPAVTIFDNRSAAAGVVNARPHARPHRLQK